MADIIARAEAALEGVSQAPWEATDYEEDNERCCLVLAPAGSFVHGIASTGFGFPWISEDQAIADANFIAAARTLIPELVAELKATRAQLERVTRLAEKWETATELGTGTPSAVTRAFAAEIRGVLERETDYGHDLGRQMVQAAVWMKPQYQDAGLVVARVFCKANGIDADALEREVREAAKCR